MVKKKAQDDEISALLDISYLTDDAFDFASCNTRAYHRLKHLLTVLPTLVSLEELMELCRQLSELEQMLDNGSESLCHLSGLIDEGKWSCMCVSMIQEIRHQNQEEVFEMISRVTRLMRKITLRPSMIDNTLRNTITHICQLTNMAPVIRESLELMFTKSAWRGVQYVQNKGIIQHCFEVWVLACTQQEQWHTLMAYLSISTQATELLSFEKHEHPAWATAEFRTARHELSVENYQGLRLPWVSILSLCHHWLDVDDDDAFWKVFPLLLTKPLSDELLVDRVWHRDLFENKDLSCDDKDHCVCHLHRSKDIVSGGGGGESGGGGSSNRSGSGGGIGAERGYQVLMRLDLLRTSGRIDTFSECRSGYGLDTLIIRMISHANHDMREYVDDWLQDLKNPEISTHECALILNRILAFSECQLRAWKFLELCCRLGENYFVCDQGNLAGFIATFEKSEMLIANNAKTTSAATTSGGTTYRTTPNTIPITTPRTAPATSPRTPSIVNTPRSTTSSGTTFTTGGTTTTTTTRAPTTTTSPRSPHSHCGLNDLAMASLVGEVMKNYEDFCRAYNCHDCYVSEYFLLSVLETYEKKCGTDNRQGMLPALDIMVAPKALNLSDNMCESLLLSFYLERAAPIARRPLARELLMSSHLNLEAAEGVCPTLLPLSIAKLWSGHIITSSYKYYLNATSRDNRFNSQRFEKWRTIMLELLVATCKGTYSPSNLVAPHLSDSLVDNFVRVYISQKSPRAVHLSERYKGKFPNKLTNHIIDCALPADNVDYISQVWFWSDLLSDSQKLDLVLSYLTQRTCNNPQAQSLFLDLIEAYRKTGANSQLLSWGVMGTGSGSGGGGAAATRQQQICSGVSGGGGGGSCRGGGGGGGRMSGLLNDDLRSGVTKMTDHHDSSGDMVMPMTPLSSGSGGSDGGGGRSQRTSQDHGEDLTASPSVSTEASPKHFNADLCLHSIYLVCQQRPIDWSQVEEPLNQLEREEPEFLSKAYSCLICAALRTRVYDKALKFYVQSLEKLRGSTIDLDTCAALLQHVHFLIKVKPLGGGGGVVAAAAAAATATDATTTSDTTTTTTTTTTATTTISGGGTSTPPPHPLSDLKEHLIKTARSLDPNFTDCHLFSAVVDALSKNRESDRISSLINEFLQSHPKPMPLALAAVVKAYGRCGKKDEVLRLWNSVSCYSRDEFIQGCLIDALVFVGEFDEALQLWQFCMRSGINLREPCQSVLVRGCITQNRYNEAMTVYKGMLSRDIPPCDVTCNYLMHGSIQVGQLDDALSCFEAMTKWSSPDLVSYSTIIKGLCDKHKVDIAYNVFFKEMEAKGRPMADIVTYNTLLEGFGRVGDRVMVEKLYEQLIERGLQPTCYTLTIMIKFYGRIKQLDEVFKVYQEMPQRFKFVCDQFVYTSVIAACTWNKRLDLAFKVLSTMRKKFNVSGRTYSTVISGCIKTDSWILLADVLHLCVQDQISLSKKDLNKLDNVLRGMLKNNRGGGGSGGGGSGGGGSGDGIKKNDTTALHLSHTRVQYLRKILADKLSW